MPGKRIIAVFDFDGTLVRGDSLVEFARFAVKPWRLVVAVLRVSPSLIRWKLGRLSGSVAKERLFSALFRGCRLKWFNMRGEEFAGWIDAHVCPPVLRRLEECNHRGYTTCIVSASLTNWIAPWAEKHGVVQVIATEPAANCGRLTGRFSTKNCIGKEKVERLKAIFPNRGEYILEVWGDSAGDNELMAYADCAYKVDYKLNTIEKI